MYKIDGEWIMNGCGIYKWMMEKLGWIEWLVGGWWVDEGDVVNEKWIQNE